MIYTSDMARAYQEQLIRDAGSEQLTEQIAPRTRRSPLALITASLSILLASLRPREPAGDAKTNIEPYVTY
jgi:hypothetical protein